MVRAAYSDGLSTISLFEQRGSLDPAAVAALTGLPHDAHFADETDRSDLGHLVHDLIDEGAGP